MLVNIKFYDHLSSSQLRSTPQVKIGIRLLIIRLSTNFIILEVYILVLSKQIKC